MCGIWCLLTVRRLAELYVARRFHIGLRRMRDSVLWRPVDSRIHANFHAQGGSMAVFILLHSHSPAYNHQS